MTLAASRHHGTLSLTERCALFPRGLCVGRLTPLPSHGSKPSPRKRPTGRRRAGSVARPRKSTAKPAPRPEKPEAPCPWMTSPVAQARAIEENRPARGEDRRNEVPDEPCSRCPRDTSSVSGRPKDALEIAMEVLQFGSLWLGLGLGSGLGNCDRGLAVTYVPRAFPCPWNGMRSHEMPPPLRGRPGREQAGTPTGTLPRRRVVSEAPVGMVQEGQPPPHNRPKAQGRKSSLRDSSAPSPMRNPSRCEPLVDTGLPTRA